MNTETRSTEIQPEPYELTVTAEFNEQYLFAVQDYHPRYIENSEFGFPIVHPALLLNQSNVTRSPSYKLSSGTAGLHARDEVEFVNPAKVGSKLRVTWKIVDIYEKRGRTYSVMEAVITDTDGNIILRRRSHGTVVGGMSK